eukprot:TRINITY_DN2231_c1_g1_i4.p1 TRINITY_DN2231_c1_g1~~TRINITY_DN2231_c1_g1_i4.p1  ORF type:complete len:297 (+),score=41.48 TRINITY_DN2231_c1_g1_i4:18-908(+)
MANQEKQDPIFHIDQVIDDRFLITKLLGRGGYGEIYQCTDLTNEELCAVKVERTDKKGNLSIEQKIIIDLNEQGCSFVPIFFSSGIHELSVNYLSMGLLGHNLSAMRRSRKTKRFSLLTTLMLGMQMIRCIREVHNAGYIHRDIKPGNFVLGQNGSEYERTVHIIDYGLSKKYVNNDGRPLPKKHENRWVGSRRYMSLNTHLRKDQGRRDDMWSILYVLIEFITGTLPWGHLSGIENLDNVRDMKKEYNNEKLVKDLPEEFYEYLVYVAQLKFSDKPSFPFKFTNTRLHVPTQSVP